MMSNFFSLLQKSVEKRAVFSAKTEAIRLVNGASDGFPGFTLDRFGKHYQAQFFSTDLLSKESLISQAVRGCRMRHRRKRRPLRLPCGIPPPAW